MEVWNKVTLRAWLKINFLIRETRSFKWAKKHAVYIMKIILTPFSKKFQAQFLTYGYNVIPEGMKYRDDAWELIGVWSEEREVWHFGNSATDRTKVANFFRCSPVFNHWNTQKMLWVQEQAHVAAAPGKHTAYPKCSKPHSTLKPWCRALLIYLLLVYSSDLLR